MAMTYEETFELTKDATFRGRVSTACVHYADFITNEPSNTMGHSTRYRWAQQTLVGPEAAVNRVIATVCNDSAVQDAPGAAITDAALQATVETAVNKLL
jgi:nicotinic acid phosphoribosyltransferase